MFTADIGVYEKETRVRQELQEFVLPFRVVVVVIVLWLWLWLLLWLWLFSSLPLSSAVQSSDSHWHEQWPYRTDSMWQP